MSTPGWWNEGKLELRPKAKVSLDCFEEVRKPAPRSHSCRIKFKKRRANAPVLRRNGCSRSPIPRSCRCAARSYVIREFNSLRSRIAVNAMTVFGHGCPSNAFGDVKRVLVAVEDDELRGGYDSHFVECLLSSGGQWETLSF